MEKKQWMLICICFIALAAFAQQKKSVAVLEPICRDQSVNEFFQQIVRGTMESAVSATDEFIAYDRMALDKIMQEQKFQRSGMVNDSQIKRLGELAGVDYVLVTEMSAYESYMNVIVKILNVETGQSTRTQNELMEMTPPNVQTQCRQLALQMFGIIDINTGRRQGELLLENGKYIGEILNGKPHGKGKLQYNTSDLVSYEGDFSEGIRQGSGILILSDGARYEGNFENDAINGYGTYYSNNGDKGVGNWKDGKLSGRGIFYWAHGDRYEGNFENNSYNGYGTYYWADGRKYVGNWKDDKKSGQGTLYYTNGARYEGNFENDAINGYGTYYWADGDKYVGNWKDDERSGQGTLYFTNGDRYEGNFENDSSNGYGTYYWNDGDKEMGVSVNGKQDGEWLRISPNGKTKKATYSMGTLIRDWHY